MKIPVHEIEGDYYCAIDDIAIFYSQKNKPVTGFDLVDFFFKENSLFTKAFPKNEAPPQHESIRSLFFDGEVVKGGLGTIACFIVDNPIFSYCHNVDDFYVLDSDIYKIAEMDVLSNGQKTLLIKKVWERFIHGDVACALFRYQDIDITRYEHTVEHEENTTPCDYPKGNSFEMTLSSSDSLFTTLSSTKQFLSTMANNTDFIMPDDQYKPEEIPKKEPELVKQPDNSRPQIEIAKAKDKTKFIKWTELEKPFERKTKHIKLILNKAEEIAERQDGRISLKDVEDLEWRGGLDKKTERSLKETFIPKIKSLFYS